MGNIQGVAFDFGNTLFSTAKMGAPTEEMKRLFVDVSGREWGISREKASALLERYMAAYWERKRINAARPEREISALDCLQKALGELALTVDDSKGRLLLNEFHGKEALLFDPMDGAIEMIGRLKAKGYRLAVLSNNPWTEAIRVAFAKHGVLSEFDLVVSSSDLGWRKPSRKAFELFLERWGLGPTEVLYVGDSFHHDIASPREMGLKTCLVNIGRSDDNEQSSFREQVDSYIESFSELLKS